MTGTEKTRNKIRGVREARKNGWRVVNTRKLKEATSWNQLNGWLGSNCRGKYTESFFLQQIAFEQDRDASWFIMKWL
jgi:hypothetical protein